MEPEASRGETGPEKINPHTITCKFDRFEVQVLLGPGDEFLGIAGVSVNTDFLSVEQRLSRESSFNVDHFYEEE